MMEYDIHTVLDLLTLVATLWVIYELRFPLADTYQKDQDTIQSYYVVRTRPMLPRCCARVTAGAWSFSLAVAAPHTAMAAKAPPNHQTWLSVW